MVPYPNWALFIAFGLVVLAMAPVPFIWFVRKFRIWRVEADIPVVQIFLMEIFLLTSEFL
jgi:hypothetical protein